MKSPRIGSAIRVIAAVGLACTGVACETFGGSSSSGSTTGGGSSGPYTVCTYNYSNGDTSKTGFGQPCSSDDECAFGECMMPGDQGNITNTQFGFCTRGCDCNDDESSRLSTEEKEVFECIYPPSPDQNARHIVVECREGGLAACQAVSSLYTECSYSDGTARKVCKAL